MISQKKGQKTVQLENFWPFLFCDGFSRYIFVCWFNLKTNGMVRIEIENTLWTLATFLYYEMRIKMVLISENLQCLNSILLPKFFWLIARKNCSSDQEKLLKFQAKAEDLQNILRSLEQFIQAAKGQNNFW
jgi:hypothetical protein